MKILFILKVVNINFDFHLVVFSKNVWRKNSELKIESSRVDDFTGYE